MLFSKIYPLLCRAYANNDTDKIKRIRNLILNDPFSRDDVIYIAKAYKDCVDEGNTELAQYLVEQLIVVGNDPNLANGLKSEIINECVFMPYYAVYLDLQERQLFDEEKQKTILMNIKGGMIFSLEKMAHSIGRNYCGPKGINYFNLRDDFISQVRTHVLSKLDSVDPTIAKPSTYYYPAISGLIAELHASTDNNIDATRHNLVRNAILNVYQEFLQDGRLDEISNSLKFFTIVQDRLGPNKTTEATFKRVLYSLNRSYVSLSDLDSNDDNDNTDATIARSLSSNTLSPESAYIVAEQADAIEAILHTFPYVKWVTFCLYSDVYELLPDSILDACSNSKYEHAKATYSTLRKEDVIDILLNDPECVESANKIGRVINEANITKWTNEIKIAVNKAYSIFNTIPLTEEEANYENDELEDVFMQNLNSPPAKLTLTELLLDYPLWKSVSYCLLYKHFDELAELINFPETLLSEIKEQSLDLHYCVTFINTYMKDFINTNGLNITEENVKKWADYIYDELDVPALEFEQSVMNFKNILHSE